MKYCISDVHGAYGLFGALLDAIRFSEEDVLYICGDIIDKGKNSIRLARQIAASPNMRCLLGNHEAAFLQRYHSLMQTSPKDFDAVLRTLQSYFPEEGALLDWDLVDWLDGLPTYIEEEDFVCVHAGVPLDAGHRMLPLAAARTETLLYDRRFKNPDVISESPKCVFFGHTRTACVCGENRILAYRRNPAVPARGIADYDKVHLDTGAPESGVLGCFCVDTCEEIYVTEPSPRR